MKEKGRDMIEVDGVKIEVEYSRGGHALNIVLSHGMYNDMHASLVEKLFPRLGGDYNTLRFNFSFAGKPETIDTERSIRELEAVIGFLGDGKTVLIGKSFGGYISSLVAASGKYDIRKVMALGYSLHEEGNPSKVFELNGVTSMKPPFVIIKGSDDSYCDTAALRNNLPNCKVYTIEGADHSFKPVSDVGNRDTNEEKVISIVLKELKGID